MNRTFRVIPEDDCFSLLLLVDDLESARIRCVSEQALAEIGLEWASHTSQSSGQDPDLVTAT